MSTLGPVRIAAVRTQTQWSSRRPVVECVATLTRRLSAAEQIEVERFPEFTLEDDQVSFSCRPEETEVLEQRLATALTDSGGASRIRRHRRGLRAIS
ncbi:MAG: hypothetical protein M3R62_05315 [Acidobacteriota bacterium]|nr:hypothetical protein [Acidobacteriota bacterium]